MRRPWKIRQALWAAATSGLIATVTLASSLLGQDPNPAPPAAAPMTLVELARSMAGRFQTPDEATVAQKLALVREEAAQLDRFLARGGPAVRTGWHRYLEWETLLNQLEQPTPDLQQLNVVLQKLYADVDGVEKGPYRELRAALHDFMNTSAVFRSPNMAQQYDKQLETIIEALEKYPQQQDVDTALVIGRGMGWLSDAGQASELVQAVRREYVRPNLYASVSARFAQVGGEESLDETIQLSDNILGTSLVGVARTTGNVRLALIPNQERAEFEIRLDGTALSENTGTNRGVVIYTSGRTTIAATKRISVDALGIHDEPASATCDTQTSITGICHRLRLVRNIAWNQANRQKSQAEAIANGRAAWRVQQQMDDRAEEMLGDGRTKFLKNFRNPLLRKNEFPQQMQLSTTSDRLLVTMLQANLFQLAAPSPPPEMDEHFDIAVRLHESFAGNFSEAMIGGFTLTDERLVEILEENNREVPDELKIDPSKDPWSITFARTQPIRLEVRDQKLKITIRGREFSRGEQVVGAEMDIWAVYNLERTPQGARLTREGEVQAEYPRGGFENPAKIAVKTLMRKKFDALFKSELDGQGLKLGGRFDKVGALKLGHLDASQGWLSLGWSLPPDPATTAQNLR